MERELKKLAIFLNEDSSNQLNANGIDFSCSICTELLCRPVSTPCGHNFCKVCLQQALTMVSVCPVCRDPCPFPHLMKVNTLLRAVIEQNFPVMAHKREVEVSEILQGFRKIMVGNTHEIIRAPGTASHKWAFYVRVYNDAVSGAGLGKRENASLFIERVEVFLHPSFRENHLILNKDPFEIVRVGYSTFPIQCKIFFLPKFGKAPLEVVHNLEFRYPDTQAVYSVDFSTVIHS